MVNGTTLGGGLTIQSGRTLSGSGTISGSVTIQSGGTLLPGTSPGLLEFGSGLTLDGGSVTSMEVVGTTRGTDYDAIDVTGALTYGGSLTVNFANPVASTTTFNLFDFGSFTGDWSGITIAGAYSSTLTNTGSNWTGVDSGTGDTFTFSPSAGTLQVVPEPSAVALAGMAIIGLAYGARRARRRAAEAGRPACAA